MQFTSVILSFLLFLCGCNLMPQADNTAPLFQKPGYEFPYQLIKPDDSWVLPNSLVEISGLGFADNDRLACIQDEKGIIFIYNLKARKIELERSFAKDGDYEGIEILDDDAWILKSNGTLYKVIGYLGTGDPGTVEFPTALTGKNNTEGLAFDPVHGYLLIACKGVPSLKEEGPSKLKAVYSFDLATGQLDEDPYLLINPDSVSRYKNTGGESARGSDNQNYLDPEDGNEPFMPSGIAVHPLTGDVYILGSVGKLLLVYSSKGEMLAMIGLNRKLFPQPEGICFSPDGKLFISSEGKGQPGKIMLFKPQ